MILIQLSGGLGNQLFQYALYFQLQSEGYIVKFDDTTAAEYEYSRKAQLNQMGIDYDRAAPREIEKFLDNSTNFLKRIRRKVFGRRNLTLWESDMNFHAEFLKADGRYLKGYFQSEKYFQSNAVKLKTDIVTKKINLPYPNPEFLKRIEQTNSVSIHIRRGDYVQEEFCDIYGNICTEAYYQSAVSYIKNIISSPFFYIFTNDIEWCKKKYIGPEYVIVDCNDEEHGYCDMILMSHCKHNIIANSSFSWWGAWLNENKNKIIISPAKWINNQKCTDIWSKEMNIRIDEAGIVSVVE